jgi:gluconate 2-dehydrogenase gamma chain
MESRRDTLKIIGAIGTTCAFPFAANDLYGQHQHAAPTPAQPPRGPYQPKFFTATEYETVSCIADLIIPPTDTPGALAAGVPEYIDYVVHANPEHQPLMRAGLLWLDQQSAGKPFIALTQRQQIDLLTPLSAAADRDDLNPPGAKFFAMLKNLTADGYYTSQTGLVQELGYKGNTALASFPGCTHPEHQ